MARQDIENLFRRYRGKLVRVKSVSGNTYEGHIDEITNDYALLVDRGKGSDATTYVLFEAIESIVIVEEPVEP